MTFKKIVGFGDSWMYGDELLDPELLRKNSDAHSCWYQNDPYRTQNNFLGRLGQHYNVPVENFGIPGGSQQSSIWTFLWWLEQEPCPEQCLVLVAITSAVRTSFYNPEHQHYTNDPPWNKFVHSAWVASNSDAVPGDFRGMIKQYISLTDCNELAYLNYMQSVLLFDGISARRSIPLMQFHVLAPLALTHKSVDIDVPTVIWPGLNLQEWFEQHPNKLMPNGHPNEIGHQMIAEKLISTIDSATM